MKLSKKFKQLLIEEIELVQKKMESSSSPQEAMYYFSAIPGVVQRVFNFEYNSDLVHLWIVTNPISNILGQKFSQPSIPWDQSGPVQLNKIVELVSRLLSTLKEDGDISGLCRDFAVLEYSTNGNGTYLYNKGLLKLE